MSLTDEKLSENAFYITRWLAALPLILMIAPVIILSFQGVLSIELLIAGGVVGISISSLFARRKAEYWNVVSKSFGDHTGLIIFMLFLLVGVYGELLSAAKLTEGILWLSQKLDFGPGFFTLFVYLVCSILGTAMGTSVGIIVIMTPVLYPAAIGLGVDPVIAAGAILSGAATGDHLAPVSDTTMISSLTQKFKNREGSAEISRVVRARLVYVIPALIISCVLYLIVGGLTAGEPDTQLLQTMENPNPVGLVMIVPMLVVVLVAVSKRTVFEALTYGTLVGIVVAFVFGLITVKDIFDVSDGVPNGILYDGALKNLSTIVMIIMLMGAYGVMRTYGVFDILVNKLKSSLAKTARSAELTMFGIGLALNFLLIGLVARLTVIAGPIFNELGQAHSIHPYRRANILDAVANSFSYIVPWHIWPLLMILQITPLNDANSLIVVPSSAGFLFSTFYPVVIWIIMFVSILTGFRRTFEGPTGEPVQEQPTKF